MPFTNTSELLDYALSEAFEPIGSTSEFRTMTLDFLQRSLYAIALGGNEYNPNINETWWWLQEDGAIAMKRIETLVETISFTKGSNAAVLSAGPTNSYLNYHLRVVGERDVYKIDFHNANGTAVTLDTTYAGATASGLAVEVFKIDYHDVPMGLNLYTEMKISRNAGAVSYIDPQGMDQAWPLARISGTDPSKFTIISQNGANNQATIRFNKFWRSDAVDEDLLIRYRYQKVPATLTDDVSSVPEIPYHYMHVLGDAAAYMLLDTKEDNRAGRLLGRAQAGIKAMSVENRARQAKAGRAGQILPRAHLTRKYQDQTLRTDSGLILG